MKLRAVVAAVAAAAALAGCSREGGTIDSTEVVCDEFAGHAKAGLPKSDRLDVARSIAEVRGNAKPGVKDASEVLSRSAGRSDTAYQTAADGFAQACFDAGWDG